MLDFLKGVRVLNLSRHLPGPFAVHVLSEMGAEVVNVEDPTGGDPLRSLPPYVEGIGYAYHALHAGQKSVALDLKKPESSGKVLELAKNSQIFLESFRPGVAKKLGVDYEAVKGANPDIIYCSLSGYGQTGPKRDEPGHDLNFLGVAGVLDLGSVPGIPVADFSGGLYAATTILGALHKGKGTYIDLALADAILSWTPMQASKVFESGRNIIDQEKLLSGGFACYRTYETSEGKAITVAALEPKFWFDLCTRLGKPDFGADLFSPDDQPKMIPVLEEIFRRKTREEWVKELEGLPVTAVLTMQEAVESAHFQERGMIEEFGPGLKRTAFPARIDGASPAPSAGAPELGEHNDELL